MLRPWQGNTGGGVEPGVRFVRSLTRLAGGPGSWPHELPDRGYSPSVALRPGQAGPGRSWVEDAVGGTCDAARAPVQDVSVDLGRADIVVTE